MSKKAEYSQYLAFFGIISALYNMYPTQRNQKKFREKLGIISASPSFYNYNASGDGLKAFETLQKLRL